MSKRDKQAMTASKPKVQQTGMNAPLAALHSSWKKLPLSRDKADTLLLLLACVLVLLPHVPALPWWVSACSSLLLTWRAWLTLTGRRLPPSWILLPISLLLMAGVFLTFRTLLGRETGVTMLALLLACKLLEMHAKRDLFVVIYLSFFLLLTSFFYSQTFSSAAMTLTAVVALLTAQLSFQYTGLMPSLWQRTKFSLTILGLAIPLTVVCFFLFPRIQGPLWSLPGDANSSRSGLSDSMSPGNISKLALSEEIAFRVKFAGAAPAKSLLYWRGIVLNRFDGRTWSHEEAPPIVTESAIYRSEGAPVRQQIILEPNGQKWLFALDIPTESAHLDAVGSGVGASINTQLEMTSSRVINERIRYETTSYPAYALQTDIPALAKQNSLLLPVGFNPRTLAYARQLGERIKDDTQRIQEVLQLFRREQFIYTLEPPLLGTNSIDEFMFGSRAGFCEHYSSAFVVLMRGMGIPARVVTGYQGGLTNRVDGYMEIRQSDAHAWAEVWLAGRGWLRVDPTAAVAPERVMQNLFSTQPQRGMTGLVNLAMANSSWLHSMRMQWTAANNAWNMWVLNYNQAKQLNVMRALGLSNLDWTQLAVVFFLIALMAMALVALPLLRHRVQLSAPDRLYLLLCARLASKGITRESHEGPLAFMQRLKVVLSQQQFEVIEKFLALYMASKYGKNAPSEATIAPQLKKLLAQYRRFH